MPNLSSRTNNLKEYILNFFLPPAFVSTQHSSSQQTHIQMIHGKNAFHLNPDNPNLFKVKYHPHYCNEKNIRDGKVTILFKDQSGTWTHVPTEHIMMIDSLHHEIVLLIK
jgi:hypothetical protein